MVSRCIPLVLFMLSSEACAQITYSSKSISGQVVDADTSKPIEGAVVVASWILSPSFGGQWIYDRRLHIAESLTDTAGRYSVPGWGPEAAPRLRIMDDTNPHIAVFKVGYWPLRLEEKGEKKWEMLTLKPFKGSLDDRAQSDFIFYMTLRGGVDDDYHDWANYPNATAAMCDEQTLFKSERISGGLMLPRGKELSAPPVKIDPEIIRRCNDAS